MAVTITGMFGANHTYFAESPVVITVDNLEWPPASPFNVVRVHVVYDGKVVGKFRGDTGRQSSISFDISSALRAIWSEYDFSNEVYAARITGNSARTYKAYSLMVYTEYVDSRDGEFTQTGFGPFAGGRCAIGGMTEWERSLVTDTSKADLSWFNGTNLRNGDASTKPSGTPERVGADSITSWVDIQNNGTTASYYSPSKECDPDSAEKHAPIVLRDSIPYTDFLFVNRRGAVETCSALMKESMSFDVEKKRYAVVKRPSFIPTRTATAFGTNPRRGWQMSSGLVSREWAEWWATEFLPARRHWMLWKGPGAAAESFVPVIVEPAKKSTAVYDKSKQDMAHVDFTVTLALEG